jgi:hypothetical protein
MRGVTRMEEGAGRTLTVTGFAPALQDHGYQLVN